MEVEVENWKMRYGKQIGKWILENQEWGLENEEWK